MLSCARVGALVSWSVESRRSLLHRVSRLRLVTAAPAALVAGTLIGACAASPAAMAADSCPNAAVRTGPSASLPDCRGYELVSPDLNHASLSSPATGYVLNGDTMLYYSVDAPDNANFATASNLNIAKRDPVHGWSGSAMSPPVGGPTAAYFANSPLVVSRDLKSLLYISDQGPDGPPSDPGNHLWLGHSDGTVQRLTTLGQSFVSPYDIYTGFNVATGWYDLKDIFFQPEQPQHPGDPAGLMYHWSNGQSRPLGVLPDGTLSTSVSLAQGHGPYTGASVLPPVSEDGEHVLFFDGFNRVLYLANGDDPAVNVGATQRTVDPDPNPEDFTLVAGMTKDGAKVVFASRSELTNDAYTGRSGGVATDAGNDLYSYDVASGDLTDLTVDLNPADVATGANVQQLVAVSEDGSSIYFTANGQLAPGATPGQTSLYLWHDGHISFLARADGLQVSDQIALTPDGQTIGFTSTDSLTGYDNTDPSSGIPHREVFVAGPGKAVVCASCHPDGSRPVADSYLAGAPQWVPAASSHAISDDGKRVFFESADQILPQASSGLPQVFEYTDGKVASISPGDSATRAYFMGASPSGDDVFFGTHDTLVPNPNGGDGAVYDARVGGGFAQPVVDRCTGVACQGQATAPASVPAAGTVTFAGPGNLPDEERGAASSVSTSKTRTVKGTSAALKIKVPAKGKLTVSGTHLATSRRTVSKAQTVTVTLKLTSSAVKSLERHRTLKAKAKVTFTDSAGHASSTSISLTFKVAAGKGR